MPKQQSSYRCIYTDDSGLPLTAIVKAFDECEADILARKAICTAENEKMDRDHILMPDSLNKVSIKKV